ncbi:MAG: flagellar biosynthetic protein FliO, partial [Burkholderiaceae bacterium]|nr:flagellar biosynthetic protein FliO [Burkholderiaceae bacterium]
RVVTVEVGPENARTCLVLGVTAQHISCLHVLPMPFAGAVPSSATVSAPPFGLAAGPSFATEIASAVTRSQKQKPANG